MTYVVFFTFLLLITLLGSYLVVEKNRRIAIEAKKKLFNDRVSKTSLRLKLKLNELLEAKVIRPKYVPKIQAIVNNFFVVQGHTDENLQKLESITDLLINILSHELSKTYETSSSSTFADNIQYFVSELPPQGILYNKVFYTETLPSLIILLRTAELAEPAENNMPQQISNEEQSAQEANAA